MLDVAIIGGGLAGLSLARQLQAKQLDYTVFESRTRFGGRILSRAPAISSSDSGFRFDLGPSWIWPDEQPLIASLLQQFSIACYPQWQEGINLYMNERDAPPQGYRDDTGYYGAYRIAGGTYQLINVLLQQLPTDKVRLKHSLQTVHDKVDHVELQFDVDGQAVTIAAKKIVLCIPLRVLAEQINFTPALDQKLVAMMKDTPTWMAGHAKAVVVYDRPFWREAKLSGNGFAIYPGAVLREIFDACSEDQQYAAISGFFGLPPAMRQQYRADIHALILEQMVRLFGKEAANPQDIMIQDWSEETYTSTLDDQAPLHEHPQYGHQWLQLDHWNDKLYFAGTETAKQFGGYLEGALESAQRVANSLSI